MKANRRKHVFRVTGHGKAAMVVARTRGAAVHQWRRLCQPVKARSGLPFERCGPGAVPGVKQLQPRTLDDGSWDDVQIERKGAA